jgi:hypothetical protein
MAAIAAPGIESPSAKITTLGALYGSLAPWRKSLRPGMMAHAWSDILNGTFRIGFVARKEPSHGVTFRPHLDNSSEMNT